MKTITITDEDAATLHDILKAANARALGSMDARHEYTDAEIATIKDRVRVGNEVADAAVARRDSDQACETCRGSGMVAVGKWGSRPPRVPCPDCDGTGERR